MGSSYAEKLAKSLLARVYGLRQTDESGCASYYFIDIEPAKEKAFLRMLNGTASFVIEDYGTLLRRGTDTWLSPDVIYELETKYKVKFLRQPC